MDHLLLKYQRLSKQYISLLFMNNRAPGLDVYEFHSQGKKDRARILNKIQRRGGICLTSYGIIVNCAQQLASDEKGNDYRWVIVAICMIFSFTGG
jgi:hypothetical protein